MDVCHFDYSLPAELVAQESLPDRSAARLLHLSRGTPSLDDRHIADLPGLLQSGDLLVVNDTRVFPARLLGRRASGGAAECLLVRRVESSETAEAGGHEAVEWWEALVHPGQRLNAGAQLTFSSQSITLHAEVRERHFLGRRLVRLSTPDGSPVQRAIDAIGHVPLPPYIKRADRADDRERYQTIFAAHRGSIAAPTAGLHFSPSIMAALHAKGVMTTAITLHVGYGTFQPVRVQRVEDHRLDSESCAVTEEAADAVRRALADGRRVIAVGTTTTRALESLVRACDGQIVAWNGSTDLCIYPGFDFRVVGGLLTNLHLPRSSLLMLVAAFAGREAVLAAYRHAVAERYRFFSYGDAMLIL
jgi:S-adenosylmethionine:tRNA ribosyltransferase-isomerase